MAQLQWRTFAGLPAGDYPAVIQEIQEDEGKFGPQLRFQFVILDGDGQLTNRQIRGWCSAKWGPGTKLFEWTKAILGKNCPPPGAALDTDLLLRRRCDIRVEARSEGRSVVAGVYPYRSITTVQ